MREDQIRADIAARRERPQEVVKLIGRDGLAPVLARNTTGFQPIVMNERRTRMLDRPADDASGGRGSGHASSTTELRSTPISGLSTSIVSPGFNQTGESDLPVFLTGVPVQITSPALSVMKLVPEAMMSANEKIMLSVVSCCVTSPFLRTIRCSGLARSKLVSIHGPIAPEASKFLPWVTLNWPCRVQSRIVPSLHKVRPAIISNARSFGTC